MLSLTYLSSSVGLLPAQQVSGLLADIRPRNQAAGLTGMLLYNDGNFIQVLEGPDAQVETTFAAIENDPRHRGIMVLLREHITERQFPTWSMGFRDLKGLDINTLDGYDDFLRHPVSEALGHQAKPAFQMLEMFRRTMR